MKIFLTASLLAIGIMPLAAQAHDNDGGRWRDRHDVREQQYQYRDVDRYGNYREQRQDYREHQNDWRRGHEYHRDYADDRGYRDHGRSSHAWGGQRWVRDHRDAVLIDTRSGRVIRVIPRYWG